MLMSSLFLSACYTTQGLPETDGGSDSDTDTDSDTDSDSDSDTDSDSDSDSDSDGPGDPACMVEYLGECNGLVAGCASCGEGSVPHADLADCDDDEWCCVTAPEPSNDCEEGDGVCVPFYEDSECPPGWGPVYTSCEVDGAICCMPGDGCV